MTYTAEQRIYVNADRTKVVPAESPEAAFLLVGEGGQLADEEASRYGLTGAKAAEPIEDKAVEQPENKERPKAGNK